ncbi:MAG: type 4a pilus biogenesis protein PilO [Methylococcales symbiont of Hymedesmia sp. n. MRB-2018]|nr:MAG: type 4a pilus biogenesis protein PilO [Methylococcales symbiont of Hymedesmia sp. n. MRB-2018]KAF3983732.1 MAG: type 4a pilus biogenesis protein PilO [Methylococcales symbiont of Hymedesmia sp. n. MRB-2018]
MNLAEVNWDLNAAGTWPLTVKIATIVLASLLVVGALYYYITIDQLKQLDQLQMKEQTLKTSFESKQRKTVNLADYRDQLKQLELSLGEMIKQMPSKAEVANLLIDISQTGLASGLEFRLFKPTASIRKDFYSELPISIDVVGKYQELSLFISGLASLSRIVTIHNVAISTIKSSDMLNMSATIKTYNEETGEIKKKKKKGRGG